MKRLKGEIKKSCSTLFIVGHINQPRKNYRFLKMESYFFLENCQLLSFISFGFYYKFKMKRIKVNYAYDPKF